MTRKTYDGGVPNLADAIRLAAADEALVASRAALARFAAETFSTTGHELHVLGHIIGSDRVAGASPWGHGTDETVAVSVLLRIATQLLTASADLFAGGRDYAGAALLRQMVEIEYLAWAFETGDRVGERWLRSDRRERELLFRPAALRKAAKGKFRGKDYGYHCELGGHPVPGAGLLLNGDAALPQLLLADLLGHVGRIWDHLVGWARGSSQGEPILSRNDVMVEKFVAWKSSDPLAQLPPPT